MKQKNFFERNRMEILVLILIISLVILQICNANYEKKISLLENQTSMICIQNNLLTDVVNRESYIITNLTGFNLSYVNYLEECVKYGKEFK